MCFLCCFCIEKQKVLIIRKFLNLAQMCFMSSINCSKKFWSSMTGYHTPSHINMLSYHWLKVNFLKKISKIFSEKLKIKNIWRWLFKIRKCHLCWRSLLKIRKCHLCWRSLLKTPSRYFFWRRPGKERKKTKKPKNEKKIAGLI